MADLSTLDHEALAESRLATEYRGSVEKLIPYLKALMSESNNIEQALQQCIVLRTIDTATGEVLDVLGELVGQGREVIDTSNLTFFGFAGAGNEDSFGDENNPTIGSRFASRQEIGGQRIMDDPEYRLFIKARIARNMAKGTIEDIITQMQTLFDAPQIRLEELGNANLRIGIGRLLTANEEALITQYNIIPKPAGVQIAELYYYEADSFFAFQGVLGALGFDEGLLASSA